MRVHINLDAELLRQVDELVGPRGRSPFVADAVRKAVEEEIRWRAIKRAAGGIADHGHDWDEDPAAWVRAQRRADPRGVG
jgi:Arc/MetJ family transcription regulator